MNAFIMAGTTLAGKTLHGTQLAKRLGMDYVSSGDIARSFMDGATKAEFAEGKLSPHDYQIRSRIFALMSQSFHRGRHIVLDGFPRTPAHVAFLVARETGMRPIVVELDVARDVILARGRVRGRDEFDNEATIIKRNEVYIKETKPALEFLATHFGLKVSFKVENEIESEIVTSLIITRLKDEGVF